MTDTRRLRAWIFLGLAVVVTLLSARSWLRGETGYAVWQVALALILFGLSRRRLREAERHAAALRERESARASGDEVR
jgi:type IV secretory pathway TrbD component